MGKGLVLFILLNLFAGALVYAQTADTVGDIEVSPVVATQSCEELIARTDSDYQDINNKIRDARLSQQTSYQDYISSFNKMTELLFQMTNSREEETKKLVENRDQLKDSLVAFNTQKTPESSKNLNETYMNLTVRLYTAMLDSQKNLESLKSELAQVESTRGQYDLTKKDFEAMDQQKLSLEAKLINLKIRCH